MWLVLVIIVIAAVVVWKMGVFRKPGVCKHCGKQIKGIEQVVFGTKGEDGEFILCKSCASSIKEPVRESAKAKWCYEDYLDFLKWNEETKDERAQFNQFSKDSYGGVNFLTLDIEHKLFQAGTYGEIFRFEDVASYKFRFVPTGGETDDGKLKGNETVEILMIRPAAQIKMTLVTAGSATAQKLKHVLPGSEHEYFLSPAFGQMARLFSACHTMELRKQDGLKAEDPATLAAAMFIYGIYDAGDITKSNIEFQKSSADEAVARGIINAEAAEQAYNMLLEYADAE